MAARLLFWLSGFASIVMLLGHLYAMVPMARLAGILGPSAVVAMCGAVLLARRASDEGFFLRLRSGFFGGLWGTLGYDLLRIPFHALGQNPFAPIRAYGMWLASAPFSTPATDALGLAYHLATGVTFGWIYSFALIRRHLAWGILWGLALETLAVLSPFGEVFAIRQAYSVLGLAYAAHLFYGLPLGLACRSPERLLKPGWGAGGLILLLLFCCWFQTAWQPLGKQGRLAPGELVIGQDALYPGWSDRPAGSVLLIRNLRSLATPLKLRRPDRPSSEVQTVVLEPGELRPLPLPNPGVYQIGAADLPWRSVFVAVRRDGDYRPKR